MLVQITKNPYTRKYRVDIKPTGTFISDFDFEEILKTVAILRSLKR